ncbi:2-dehydropantoate 2-reductase [Pseudoalteromonas sp. MMG010]|uniref:ketopantoate reductase family protein n=1 Tax=Pseudoalteromonas sp. MMG010 TaxID=2822685 RepID=UPI001B3A3B19|nr:2-dehydropantoate 2-reductase [Pseudoalteromonas sp. MMG010]MBQ4833982.1 2-dehydropantoate 2-reductase [Pseudoalteromonas sp. MMG010]
MANILIVGDGAIGQLFSYFLGNENKVQLLSRKNTTNTRFYSPLNSPTQAINAQCISLSELKHAAKPDIIIFTVKAFQVASAFSALKPYIPEQCNIVLSHNGMGNVEELSTELNTEQALFFLSTNMAGYKSNDFIVQHSGKGSSVIGACNTTAQNRLNDVFKQLSSIPLLSCTQNIDALRFEKLLVNIAINPLTALHNVKNGQLRAPKFNSIITHLLAEACHVANAKGIHVNLVEALNHAYHIMYLTAQNYSSMHQDVKHKRATEIDAICGYISNQGKLYNINTPYNDQLLHKIKAKKSVV